MRTSTINGDSMEILIGIFGMIYPPVNENIAMVCYGIDGPMVDDLPFFFTR